MSRRLRAVAALGLALAAGTGAARADELLQGPHPFLRDNELSIHGGFGFGPGDAASGTRAAVDYGLNLGGGLWFDLQLAYLSGSCDGLSFATRCGPDTGDVAEVLGGFKWKFQMDVPVVPYAKLVVGPLFVLPDRARSAIGLLARGAIGGKYFFYDWLGVGAELGLAFGGAAFRDEDMLSGSVGWVDFALGAELQF